MAAAFLVAASLAFTLSPAHPPRALAPLRRSRPPCAQNDPYEPRDPEVQKATDVSRYLPSRFGLVTAGLVGGVCIFFPDSPPPVGYGCETSLLDG